MRAALAGALLLLSSAEVANSGSTPSSAVEEWRSLTRMDVEAAYALLEENHPGALPEVGDMEFLSALAAGHAKALARATTVTNLEAYTATMGEFAAAMGDGHIRLRPRFLPRMLQWAGIVATKRGSNWLVANEDRDIVGLELTGARVINCDGQEAEARAFEALHFRADMSSQASQSMNAGWLLIDDGNPFVARPRECTFESGGQNVTVALHWANINLDTLMRQYWTHPYGEAGYGVRPSGAGYWIAIQQLSPRAQPVIEAVKSQQRDIRSAPYTVVDLRGNGGGDDAYGRALAEALYGSEHVSSVLGPKAGEAGVCDPVFRASQDNIAAIEASALEFVQSGDKAGADEYTAAVRSMKAAAARGHALTGNPSCKPKTKDNPRKAPSMMLGKVLILTDVACFSSCIGTVEFFRKLGATQVGQTTGADTHYSEVREIGLPSELGTFSTLTAIEPEEPRNIGPYAPAYEYSGDISDTNAVEKWITAVVLHK